MNATHHRFDRDSLAALGVAVVAGVVTLPVLGLAASIVNATIGFFVVALVNSGYGVGRAVAWGALNAALVAAAVRLSFPAGRLSLVAATALFVGGVFSPWFRAKWFGQKIE
jgi:hypothetical protein